MNAIEYVFDDMCLITIAGTDVMPVSGMAEITYNYDGEWSISAIYLEHVEGDKRTYHMLDRELHERIFLTIYDRLENENREGVQEAVREAIKADRECEADNYADYRREQRREVA